MFHFLTDGRARTRRTRRPAVSQLENVEALENRMCPTASFTATLSPVGVLSVTEVATGSGSNVTISENDAHNRITVTGSGSGTAINGGPSASFDLSLAPINSIKVTYSSANNANDTLTVQDVRLPNSLTVALAAKTPTVATLGNNTVNILSDRFNTVDVEDPLGSTAHDHVTLDNDTVGRTTVIEANGIGDSIRVTNSATGNTLLEQGSGLNDELDVDNVRAGILHMFNNSQLNEGDFASIENVIGDSLDYRGGAGNNFVEVENLFSDFSGTVDGGSSSNNVVDTDGSPLTNVELTNFASFINQPDSSEA